ncbi:AMP-binding protein [Brucepastera parasyntrophica]|uniref:AMP-binding protein n=1 Tax=Brucepastera parasyntrophica TaxID=2880008 RepID=UPI00210CF00E|nr:AMP-binding protein [Brucepastera parasyntrophica]ULQ58888.1 AMP-binding protein [Brucepastera parasyntrophica]
MKDFGTTMIHATPSYLLHLHAAIEGEGYDRSEFKLRKAITGAEPHSEELRRKIQNKLGIHIYNCYGMSELNGPGVAFECIFQTGMHIWEDRYIAEILNPETFEPVGKVKPGNWLSLFYAGTRCPLSVTARVT